MNSLIYLFPNRSLLLRVPMETQKKGKERKRDKKRAWAEWPETPPPKVALFPIQHDFMLKWIFAIATSPEPILIPKNKRSSRDAK